MKLTMEKMRVATRAIHSKSRRIKGTFISKGHLQNLKKKKLIYIHEILRVSFVDKQFTDPN